MMELGSAVALGSLCISGGAVAITAIRTFGNRPPGGKDGINGINGKNGSSFPCAAHSGLVVGIEAIKENQDRQEKWLEGISADMKKLLARGDR